MLARLLSAMSVAIAVIFASPVWSYDAAMAESYAKLFEPVKGPKAGKAMHLMTPAVFVNKAISKEPIVVLDVRTPAETGIYSATLPGTLAIPMSELFSETNLERIPTDKTVVVICMSGTRATAAGTALRHIGFDNVYVLKGGFKALAGYMGPKEANTPPTSQSESQPIRQPESMMQAPPYSSGRYPAPPPFPTPPARRYW